MGKKPRYTDDQVATALKMCHGNRIMAARLLEIQYRNLCQRISKSRRLKALTARLLSGRKAKEESGGSPDGDLPKELYDAVRMALERGVHREKLIDSFPGLVLGIEHVLLGQLREEHLRGEFQWSEDALKAEQQRVMQLVDDDEDDYLGG